jgi:hypothetical protein
MDAREATHAREAAMARSGASVNIATDVHGIYSKGESEPRILAILSEGSFSTFLLPLSIYL